MVRSLLLGLLVLGPLPARAQAPDSSRTAGPAFEVESPEAVVTAGRLPVRADRTGRHLTVITAAEIARSPARSLDELLRFEAGVLVTPRAAFGAQADLSLRGATFNGVVVLVDGARFNDPMTGHFLSDFPIPLAEIARIEVLRGPDAAAWGADAVGGVVHVVTHTGVVLEADPFAAAPQAIVEAQGAAGGLATALGDLAVRRRGAGVRASAAVAGVRTDGEPVLNEEGAPVVGSAGPVRTDLERTAGTAAATFPIGGHGARFYVRAAADRRSFGAYQFYTPFASDTAREATSTLWAQARLASAESDARTTWNVQVAARRHTDRYTYFPGLDPNEHTTRRATVTAEAAHRLAPSLVVGGGVSGEGRDVVSNSLGTHGDVSGGVFALARWTPTADLAVSASARLDADPGFGVEPTPMLAATYRLHPVIGVRAAAGRAVRAPNYVERYFNTAAPRPGGNLGNPELRAERAWNAEVGVDLEPATGVVLQATAFWRRTDDLIDYVRTAVAGEEVFLAQNILAVRAAGLEATANVVRVLAPRVALRLAGGYAYTDVRLEDEAFNGDDFKYVFDHAPHLVQARAALDAGPVRGTVETVHKARLAPALGFTVFNARLAVVNVIGGSPVEVFGEVRNVFDERYTEVFGAPMPGRFGLAGVSVRFAR